MIRGDIYNCRFLLRDRPEPCERPDLEEEQAVEYERGEELFEIEQGD
jgi:hypothetical protein